jgi:hypothetical protein
MNIEDFFSRNKRVEFMNCVPMPSASVSKSIARLTKYKARPGLLDWFVGKARRVLAELGVVSKEQNYNAWSGDASPYAGSQWWALTRDACAYVLAYATQHPHVMKFYENTLVPDEMVFQTILDGLEQGGNRTFTNPGSSHRTLSRARCHGTRRCLWLRRSALLPQGNGRAGIRSA